MVKTVWVRDHLVRTGRKLKSLMFWSHKLPEGHEETDWVAHHERAPKHTHRHTRDFTRHFKGSQSSRSNLWRMKGAFYGGRWGVLESGVWLMYQTSTMSSRWFWKSHLILEQGKRNEEGLVIAGTPSVMGPTAAVESWEPLSWKNCLSSPPVPFTTPLPS